MAIGTGIEKRLCYSLNEVLTTLTNFGFTRTGNKILWDEAENTTNCYWQISNDTINFKRTDGQLAFTKSLVDFNMTETIEEVTYNRNVCLIVFIPLMNNGCALYLGMVREGTRISDVNFTCANTDSLVNNGLVVCSPAEDDDYWYYGWNAPALTDTQLNWCLDNGHNNYEYENVTQIPVKQLIPSDLSLTLVRAYLNFGGWSKNFRIQVSGDLMPPASIFKVNGQKYIVFSNNETYRAPAYKLPGESVTMNLVTSTEEYSPIKTYAVGDYCIYGGLLYKCIYAITEAESFDQSHWRVTTVHDELIIQGGNIYGN